MSRAVTISILTYKRHQHLRRALESVLPYADQVAGIIVRRQRRRAGTEEPARVRIPDRALHRRAVKRRMRGPNIATARRRHTDRNYAR